MFEGLSDRPFLSLGGERHGSGRTVVLPVDVLEHVFDRDREFAELAGVEPKRFSIVSA